MSHHIDCLEQTHRLEVMGAIASGVAHDMNNQLTVMLNYLDITVQKLGPDHVLTGGVLEVQRAALRCVEIASTLLRFGVRS